MINLVPSVRRSMALLVLVAAIASCPPRPAQAADIKIGALYPLTGSLSVLGTEALAGAQIAVDLVNEKGGVDGQKVVLVTADAPTPATATSEARRLVTREGVKFLVGTLGSSLMLSNAAVANQFGVPYWELSSSADELVQRGYKNVFRVNDSNATIVACVVRTITTVFAPKLSKDPKELKIAVINEDSAFGSGIAGDFMEQSKAAGLQVVLTESYSMTTQDLSSLVLKLKQQNPDILVSGTLYNDSILFWRQARNAGYTPPFYIAAGSASTSSDYQKALGTDIEGHLVCDMPPAGAKPEALKPEVAALQAEFIKRYVALKGSVPAAHSVRHFSSMYILLTEILRKVPSLDPAKIREAALNLEMPEGSTILGYGVKFGDNGQNQKSFDFLLQWQNGKLVAVGPAQFAVAPPVMLPLPSWEQRDAANAGKPAQPK
jgi:branched-chain amino acid transport system substrate-binding protein